MRRHPSNGWFVEIGSRPNKPGLQRFCLSRVTLVFWVCLLADFWRREEAYGVSCARPLARRRFNTRRPAFVAILARNPCVRARFKMLGWNVRFIGLVPGFVGGCHPRLKEGRQGYAGVQLVSIEQAVNSEIFRRLLFSGGTGVYVLDCLPAGAFDGGHDYP